MASLTTGNGHGEFEKQICVCHLGGVILDDK